MEWHLAMGLRGALPAAGSPVGFRNMTCVWERLVGSGSSFAEINRAPPHTSGQAAITCPVLFQMAIVFYSGFTPL